MENKNASVGGRPGPKLQVAGCARMVRVAKGTREDGAKETSALRHLADALWVTWQGT